VTPPEERSVATSASGVIPSALSPGPVIRGIVVIRERTPVVIVKGENLSLEADFFFDEKWLPSVTRNRLTESEIDPATHSSLVTGTKQAGASDPSFCSELQITIIEEQSGIVLGPGGHRFRIVNRDERSAEMSFSIPELKITTVTNSAGGPIPAQTTDLVLEVTGYPFSEPLAADWTPAGATSAEPLRAPQRLSDSKLRVTVNTGPAGTARLKISAPSGSTSVDLKVE
jgi:hypothetical protein